MQTLRYTLALLLLTFVKVASFAQDGPKLQYSIGAGASIDGNNLLWGLNFTNELNYKLGRRTSLNTGLTFYQSIGNLEGTEVFPGQKSKEQSSGIFITPMLKYDIIQRPSGFKLAFAMGPSLQLGGESFLFNPSFSNSEPSTTYAVNKYQRIGIMTELEAEWKTKNPNIRNAASISAYGTDLYFPWYINATYKIRFGIGKN
ncbi:hypothetical protein [Algoriphagus sp.]|uniref:hypothetical protein n=1 Tax=Algoriphagus sp. TaxID=1872435 RepID=UPI003918F313